MGRYKDLVKLYYETKKLKEQTRELAHLHPGEEGARMIQEVDVGVTSFLLLFLIVYTRNYSNVTCGTSVNFTGKMG
jgi:hypothetical protein